MTLKRIQTNIRSTNNIAALKAYKDIQNLNTVKTEEMDFSSESTTREYESKDNNLTCKNTIFDKIKMIFMNDVDVGTVLQKYNDFSNLLTDKGLNLGNDTFYVSQGICNNKYGTFISAYHEDKIPVIKYYDNNGNMTLVRMNLPEGTHAGGISYDEKSDNFIVSSNEGKIAIFSGESVRNCDNKGTIEPKSIYKTDLSAASYLTINDGKLYVGKFNENSNGKVIEYDLNDIYIKPTGYEFEVPKKVQGISFCEKDGKEYMALSCSYGRTSDGNLKLYSFDKNNNDYSNDNNALANIKTPPMLEQISFNEEGNLSCVFESNAESYKYEMAADIPIITSVFSSECEYRVNSVVNLDVNKYLK